MSMWEPTHLVGTGPTGVWAQPDPAQQPVGQVEPGHRVVVSETRSGWAEVLFDNGFRGWVDASHLVPLHSPPAAAAPPPARRSWVPIVLVLVVVAGLVAFLVTRTDSKKGAVAGTSSTSSASTIEGLVRYTVPAGWSSSADGLTIAEDKADLFASQPAGPRISAVVGSGDDDPIAVMNDTLADAAFDIVEEPTETKVSGVAAVSFTLRKDNVFVRFIAAHPAGGDSVVFTVSCPVERFEALRADLEAAPGLRT